MWMNFSAFLNSFLSNKRNNLEILRLHKKKTVRTFFIHELHKESASWDRLLSSEIISQKLPKIMQTITYKKRTAVKM